jgi:hypothetical protein
MERGSSKHGPQLDQAMAHETEDFVRSGHSTHTDLRDRIAALPGGRRFANVGEVARAIGILPGDGRW